MNQPPGHNPFEPPPVGSYGGGPARGNAPLPATTEALAALVCGLLAWSCLPLGIAAVWLGVRARRAVRENPERAGGDNLALGGIIAGAFFLGLWLLYLGMILVMLLLGALSH